LVGLDINCVEHSGFKSLELEILDDLLLEFESKEKERGIGIE
jgi:hypothetical protein